MASTSASSIQKSFKYDVFLSFRGEDTRKNFVDHLYHALQQKSIITYKDDEEIKKGKSISDELFRSIQDSKFYIIILSKNYASSSWCLDELTKIMECHRTIEQTAYPVFYNVEPTEVRKQSGTVGEAFAKLVNEEAAGRWRDALKEVAGLAGWELKNTFDGHEAKLIQKIVTEISLELRYINLSVDRKLIGLETRVKYVVSSLQTDIDDVRMIGIKGMGGAGKTTLARAVFDQISFQFEGSSFVENVREYSKGSLCGLKSLQKQVFSDVQNKQDITVSGVYEGKKLLKQSMCGRKVLVVLDDVDHIDQLSALAGETNWFKPGSRVIITTRDEQLLIAHRVNLILDVNLLSDKEAICLFSRYAFGRDIPIQGYAQLSKQVVRYAAGLPLAIRVLGSFLCGKDQLEWADALERLKTIPLKETQEILELSYNSLEEDCKEIFLDVACILKGWDKEEAITALESCGFHARNGLRVLERKSLITLSGLGRLSMHDHIEEMGRNIVRRLNPNEPYKHSRLWIEEEVVDILVEEKGTETTRYIKVKMDDPVIFMKGLRKMKELRFLDVICGGKACFHYRNDDDDTLDLDNIGEDSLYLPNALRYLRWNGYPFTCLPQSFQANNLVGLEIVFSNLDQLWKGGERKVLKNLKFIKICWCKLRTLDIGLIPNLERLNLEECKNLVEVHMPVKNFKLKSLNLCQVKLRTLNLARAHNLETLIVKNCEDLVELHMPVQSVNLNDLHLQRLKLKTLNLTWAVNLRSLILKECEHLEELHMPVESLYIQVFRITSSKLRTLDLVRITNLDTLKVKNCEDLVELHMPVQSVKLTHLHLQCFKLKTLNLTWAVNLKRLILKECEDLEELHIPVERLYYLQLSHSNARAKRLNMLSIDNCEDLVELHIPVNSDLHLNHLHLEGFKLKTINLRWVQKLNFLDFVWCNDLEIHVETKGLGKPNHGPTTQGFKSMVNVHNWRKYGEKHLISYYKCTHPNCAGKKSF